MPSFKDTYLIAYNVCCIAGWSYVLLIILSFLNPLPCCLHSLTSALASIYTAPTDLPIMLTIVQCAAIMEVIHAITGLVRSPALVTFLQVNSRIQALFCLVYSPSAQIHYGAGLMILGWALVEVPRYSFYVAALITGDATKGTPYPLFYLRYSLFYVLYPLGITGEVLTFLNAINDPVFLSSFSLGGHGAAILYWFYYINLLTYGPGGPYMYMNMVTNRSNAFKKRFAKPPPPPRGIMFPKGSKGDRSTSEAGIKTLAAAVGSVDSDAGNVISKTRNWRFGYTKHFLKMVELQCASPADALTVAKAGLDHMHSEFEFHHEDGTVTSFKEAMAMKNDKQFETGFIQGEGVKAKGKVLEVPYNGKMLSGDSLKAQVNKWVEYGTIEQSAGDAINDCIDHPKWLDLSNKYFVLLGAGSAMGPFLVLMALGANIIAIDLDRAGIWKNLIATARKSCGTMTFPVKKSQKECATDDELYANAGCNLFTETPLIKDWLLPLYPGKDFVVGSYAYLDGALHVQVSLAMDAICAALSKERKASLAYLCTPTDAHLCSKEATDASLREYNRFSLGKLYEVFWQVVSRSKFLKKNARKPVKSASGDSFHVCDGLAVAQGPNYALAKRLQHWRAILARADGCIVSSNIAPATSTASVVNARTFAWAYGGMPYFKPYEIFTPDTSKHVMLAILAYDLNSSTSSGNPKTKLLNPNQLFQYGSFNGGAWRCAYTVSSIGEVSVLVYFGKCVAPYVGIIGVVGVGVFGRFMGLF